MSISLTILNTEVEKRLRGYERIVYKGQAGNQPLSYQVFTDKTGKFYATYSGGLIGIYPSLENAKEAAIRTIENGKIF